MFPYVAYDTNEALNVQHHSESDCMNDLNHIHKIIVIQVCATWSVSS
jgi:hypothetical protein